MAISATDRAPGSCPVCGEKSENFLEGGVCPFVSVAHSLNEPVIEKWKKEKPAVDKRRKKGEKLWSR